MWGSGMDWNPDSPSASDWLKVLAYGDFDRMMSYLKNKTSDEIKELLEVRETQLNISALFHVVKGTRRTRWPDSNPRHVDCVNKLIDLGANIEARDFAGCTALSYCVTKNASAASVKMA